MSTSDQVSFEFGDHPRFEEARACWNRGEREAALEGYRAAVELLPDNARGRLEYARILGLSFRIKEAEVQLDAACQLAGLDCRVLPQLALAYREIYRPEKAIERYEAARNAGRLPLPLLGELAILYERSNQVEKALAAITQCVEQVPEQPEPKFVLARLLRRRKDHAAAERVLLDLTSTTQDRPLLLVQAWTELSQLRDDLGDYEGAWVAIEKAKDLHRRFPDAEPQSRRAIALNETFRRLHEELDAGTLDAWRASAPSLEARCGGVAHLLGFPRTGTTLLEQCLGAHPGIVDSPERAVFTRDIFPALHALNGQGPLTLEVLRNIPPERLLAQRSRYLDAMEAIHGEPLNGRVHLDKNPNHTSLLAGLLRLFPESRILFALRDPRDVLVSVFLRHFPLSEFGAGLLTPGSVCLMYANDMSIWLRVREWLAGQALEVKYEDTVADLHGQAKRVTEFLGLPWDDRVLNYRESIQKKVVNSPSHDTVHEPVYTKAVARWRNYERPLGKYFERLEPFVRAFGYS